MAAAAMVAVLLTVTGGGFLLGAAVIARHRAQSVADLAALAGAARIPVGPETACAAAQRLARKMAVREIDCAVDGLDLVVTVTVAVPGRRIGPARASARAGPVGGAARPIG
ncbi:Rv3654c family TadE-like protein [Mycobacterium novum]